MAPLGNPVTWIPYGNSKDCSQGFCSMYCPQWCYIVYPPPPPFEYPNDDSTPKFSPLVVAIIGILVTAFLLVSYYIIISKYCGHRESAHRENPNPNDELQDNHNHQQPLHVSISTTGLDESLIKSIAVYKYKKGDDFFVGVTDCSVCLSEFQNDESVRLLPKCGHAFHLPCIDTWLKSHSSCPLCRSSIFTFNSSTQAPVIEIELPSRNETSSENQHVDLGSGGNEFGVVQEVSMHYGRDDPIAKPALRAFSDLGNFQGRHRVIEIRDEVYESIRSVSMDHSFRSVADVMNMNQEEDSHSQVEGCCMDAGTSKISGGESSKSRYKRRVLHCVTSPIAMKRSISSGRFSFRKIDRGRLGISPV